MIAAWLLKNWRLIVYAAAAVAALWMLALVGHWRKDSTVRLPEALAALEAEEACGEGSQCQARQAALQAAAEAKSAEVVASYEQELTSLRNRPARVVRLQAVGGALCSSGPSGSTNGASPAAGVVPGSAGGNPDIGPALYQLARDADAVAARLRALQSWNQALSAQ
jgi:hypothetical protein